MFCYLHLHFSPDSGASDLFYRSPFCLAVGWALFLFAAFCSASLPQIALERKQKQEASGTRCEIREALSSYVARTFRNRTSGKKTPKIKKRRKKRSVLGITATSPGEKHNLMFWGFSRFKNIKNIKKHKVVVLT
jgi:hypothetical protein